MRTSTTWLPATLAFLLVAPPLVAQDVMVGTIWTIHQQGSDSATGTWTFLDDGKLRTITGTDTTNANSWRWKADSLEIVLRTGGSFVGALSGQRLTGTRDAGKPTEGWWYADQVGGASVAPEGLVDDPGADSAAPATGTNAVHPDTMAPVGSARMTPMRRRNGVVAGGGGAGIGFSGRLRGRGRLELRFARAGTVNYSWRTPRGDSTAGQGTWQRVQSVIVVRLKGPDGAGLVLRGELARRVFRGQATLPDGSTEPMLLFRNAPPMVSDR